MLDPLDRDGPGRYAQQVETVDFIAETIGKAGSGLDEQHVGNCHNRMIARRGVPRVEMARQENIGPACRETRERASGAPGRSFAHIVGRLRKGVVADHDPRAIRIPGPLENRAEMCDLPLLDAAALPGSGRHGVEAGDDELVVLVGRLQVLADPAAVPRPGREGAEDRVVERDVVVAWNDQNRRRQAFEKCVSLPELPDAGTLG